MAIIAAVSGGVAGGVFNVNGGSWASLSQPKQVLEALRMVTEGFLAPVGAIVAGAAGVAWGTKKLATSLVDKDDTFKDTSEKVEVVANILKRMTELGYDVNMTSKDHPKNKERTKPKLYTCECEAMDALMKLDPESLRELQSNISPAAMKIDSANKKTDPANNQIHRAIDAVLNSACNGAILSTDITKLTATTKLNAQALSDLESVNLDISSSNSSNNNNNNNCDSLWQPSTKASSNSNSHGIR